MVRTFALLLLALALAGVSNASAASKSQCTSWSQKSDRDMGGCRSSYLNGEMKGERRTQCCAYRLETISAWQQCTAYFGPVDRRSLAESKREWGCR